MSSHLEHLLQQVRRITPEMAKMAGLEVMGRGLNPPAAPSGTLRTQGNFLRPFNPGSVPTSHIKPTGQLPVWSGNPQSPRASASPAERLANRRSGDHTPAPVQHPVSHDLVLDSKRRQYDRLSHEQSVRKAYNEAPLRAFAADKLSAPFGVGPNLLANILSRATSAEEGRVAKSNLDFFNNHTNRIRGHYGETSSKNNNIMRDVRNFPNGNLGHDRHVRTYQLLKARNPTLPPAGTLR